MNNLPEPFLAVMQEILKEEYPKFLEGYEQPRQYGLRVNTSKISVEQFEKIAPFSLKKIPWISNGFYYEENENPAKHPFYQAGLYYLQEPSAMTPASRLPVSPGDKVLDLCAAPGGKATALGACLKGEGLLVANDINKARTKALLRNVELFGLPNVFVTNEPPYRLLESFPEYFDKIMVDAPCSGEGMFRKNPAVMEAWQEKGPEYFSKIQKEIILQAFDMLKPGGKMLYSTCTFSPLENEAVITHLLNNRSARLIPMEDYEGFCEGLTEALGLKFCPECRLARRIWPHHMAGEGHFLALLTKPENSGERDFARDNASFSDLGEGLDSGKREDKEGREWKTAKNKRKKTRKKEKKGTPQKSVGKEDKNILKEFLSKVRYPFVEDAIEIRGDKVYYVPNPSFEGLGLHFLRNGVYLGDLKKNRFEPSEPFALLLTKDHFEQTIDFKEQDARLKKYLRGESFDVADLLKVPAGGWCLVLAEGYPLGFAKLTGSILKNKYPPGWRTH